MRLPSTDISSQQEDENGDRRCLNSELWHACAGPLVSLPAVGGRVVYFPQGHSEQVSNSTNRQVDAQIPNYPSLPPQLVCQLHDLTMHADAETDEVYAQMTLQPLSPQEQKEIYLPAQFGIPCKQPTNYFCKTLTASDTSTHGGFSVPRRAAEKVFPPLDFSLQPPAQELIARDLHDNEWKFRHIFRGQPKRHLLTTGWSVFVSAKRLVAGDSVLFIWNETNQLFIGIRRASRSQTVMPSSVLSSDSMHLGLLAAAAHAASTNSRFTIFYNPRSSPSEFVIPLAKYVKAVYHTRVSIGMRFRMMVETEESNVRRYMGTITGICDLEPARWPNSHWQSVKVGWDESTAGERQPRVSLWEIEPLTTFPVYPSPFSLGMKRPWQSGIRDNMGMNRLTWFQGDSMEHGMYPLNLQGVGLAPYMQPRLDFSMLSFPNDIYQVMAAAALQDMGSVNPSSQASLPLLHFQQPQVAPASTSFAQAPVFPESQPQQSFIQNAQTSQPQFQQQLQHSGILKREPSDSIHQQRRMEDQHQQVPNLVSSMPQFVSASLPTPPLSQQQHVSDLTENPAFSTVATSLSQTVFCSPLENVPSNLVNVTKNDSLVSSAAWLYRRAPAEPPLPNMEHANPLLVSKSEDTFQLPPFPAFHSDETTAVENNIMFGVNNIDSSSLLMPDRLRIGENGNLPFLSTDIIGNSPSDYANHCTNSSELLHFPDDTDTEPPTRNFVKVCKSGSFGRSLDLAKFSSYEELRNELGRLFGLEGQLEDPQRSGWQLVFVDKENDILLLGDDPWMEFVNSVWCIKILSVKEVQQMDPQGMELLGSVPTQKLSNWACEDRKNVMSGIPWLEY